VFSPSYMAVVFLFTLYACCTISVLDPPVILYYLYSEAWGIINYDQSIVVLALCVFSIVVCLQCKDAFVKWCVIYVTWHAKLYSLTQTLLLWKYIWHVLHVNHLLHVTYLIIISIFPICRSVVMLECYDLFHKEITRVMLVYSVSVLSWVCHASVQYVCFELSVCIFWLLMNLQFVLILSV